ncbi:MAG: hypothetical protein IH857_02700, partial [Deltaproteobacteria bacterium]|nr:hypothetical protein [Deltaproteobacteria bacterium]
LERRLLRVIQTRLETGKEMWAGLARRLVDPTRRLRENQMRVDELSLSLWRRFQDRLNRLKDRLTHGAGRLSSLSPLAVLGRGYSIAHKMPEGVIVKDAAFLKIGDLLRISFARGKSLCRVEEKE